MGGNRGLGLGNMGLSNRGLGNKGLGEMGLRGGWLSKKRCW